MGQPLAGSPGIPEAGGRGRGGDLAAEGGGADRLRCTGEIEPGPL